MTIESFLQRDNLARFPFVFIVTFGRSGSTLLQGLLNAIDGYCIRGENHGALFFVHKAIAEIGHAATVWKDTNTPAHAMYGAYLYRAEEFEKACLNAFFENVLNVPADARCCGFKEIRHTMGEMSDEEFHAYMDFLERSFPGAAFIFNVRSIENTARSSWWSATDKAIKYGWLVNARQRLESRARITKNAMLFSYDAWLEDPDYAGSCSNSWASPMMARRCAGCLPRSTVSKLGIVPRLRAILSVTAEPRATARGAPLGRLLYRITSDTRPPGWRAMRPARSSSSRT